MLKMKTKHLLTAMVLPALFAACTSDEFNDNTSANLKGRALLDPNFSVTIDNSDANTRFSWNEDKFGWNAFTQNDKFSSGLVDNVSGDVQDKILTNYIFSSKDGSNYTTTSQMVEGTYFFYSYPNFEGVSKREAVPFDLTSQTKIYLNNPTKTVEENQLFVSPLYKLDADHANIELPLYFVSYWSTAGIRIKNTTGESFKIRRITLKSGAESFAVKGSIDQAKLGYALKYTWNKETGKYTLPDKKDNKDLKTLDIANGGAQKDAAITVDCQAYVLENDKDVTAYIQVPYADLTSATVDITVEVETKTGTVLKTVTADVTPNEEIEGVEKVIFKRGSTMPAFGIENGGLAAYNIDKARLAGAVISEGAYADSYEAFEEIFLAAENGVVEINNLGSLKVDDDVMYLLNSIAAKSVKFMNKIEITSEGAATLKRAEFAEGATVTIAEGTYSNDGSKIENNGTLRLNKADLQITEIANDENAEIVIAENQTINTGKIVKFNAPKILTINEVKTLTITTPVLTIGYEQSVVNNGTIAPADAAKFVNNGIIINNAKGVINNITNKNTTKASDGKEKTAKIENYGTITSVMNTNDGNGSALITMKSSDAEIKTATGAADIDNTVGGYITSEGSNVVFAKYTGDKSGELGNVMACNKVIIENGEWTAPALPEGVKTLEMSGVTLNGTANIDLGEITSLKMVNCTAEKDVTFGKTTTAVLDYSTFNGLLTLGATGFTELNLRGVTFNGAVTAENVTVINVQASEDSEVEETKTTINGEVTTKDDNGSLNIAEKSTLEITVKGSIGVVNKTVISNSKGKVLNRGEIGATVNIPVGDWRGNDPKNS